MSILLLSLLGFEIFSFFVGSLAQTPNPCSSTNPCCSASNPCDEGCCSSSGYCGYGPEFCAASACVAAGSANGTCSQLSQCDPGGYPGYGSLWGSEYASTTYCPLHVCCSQYGFCGTTEDFCGNNTAVAQPTCSISNSASNRTVGYWEAWNLDRPCDTMTPDQIPIGAYTHLNFAFLYIDPDSFEITPMDESQVPLYSQFTALKQSKPGLQTWITIGGWSFTDPGPTETTFSQLVASSSAQSSFFSSLTSFLAQYGFDGVDIDWEYPGSSDRDGVPADEPNFVSFLKNLRSALDDAGDYGLSITLPSSYWYMQWFDIVDIEPIVDWFNVMTYDLFGTWDTTDSYIGPYVYADTNMTQTILDMDLLWRNNINPQKVNLGIGFYGRSYTLSDPSCTEAGCEFSAGAQPGACTQTSGILSYDEILNVLQTENPQVTLDTTNMVEIAVWDSQWVGYDDPTTLKMKLEWANSVCIGGTMVWAIDLDVDGSLSEVLGNTTNLYTAGNGTGEVFIPPSIWQSSAPSVACNPPCTMVLPPYPLGDTSIISWPPLVTSVLSSSGGTVYTVTTTFSVEPFTVSQVPLWPITVPNTATPTAQIIPKQSIMPPSFTVTLPGSVTLMPVSSINYTQYVGDPSTTVASTPVSTPAAVQTGITSGCTQFYQAVSGDSCDSIASNYGISFQQFLEWNPAVGSSCDNLWVGEYYCVSTGTGTAPAVATPTPYPADMLPGCTEFYQVESGDTCYSIETNYGISAAEFDYWNPDVGDNCADGVWLGYYYCVGNDTTSSGSGPNAQPSFYSTSHVVTIQPQATYTTLPAPILPLPYQTGIPPSPGDCSAHSYDSSCGTLNCDLFGCDGSCGRYGCDGGCGVGFCGGGCGLGGCGPGCSSGHCDQANGGGGTPPAGSPGSPGSTPGGGDDDDCSSTTTATVCTEYVSSYSTSPMTTWSTITETACFATTGCEVDASTTTTTITTDAPACTLVTIVTFISTYSYTIDVPSGSATITIGQDGSTITSTTTTSSTATTSSSAPTSTSLFFIGIAAEGYGNDQTYTLLAYPQSLNCPQIIPSIVAYEITVDNTSGQEVSAVDFDSYALTSTGFTMHSGSCSITFSGEDGEFNAQQPNGASIYCYSENPGSTGCTVNGETWATEPLFNCEITGSDINLC